MSSSSSSSFLKESTLSKSEGSLLSAMTNFAWNKFENQTGSLINYRENQYSAWTWRKFCLCIETNRKDAFTCTFCQIDCHSRGIGPFFGSVSTKSP